MDRYFRTGNDETGEHAAVGLSVKGDRATLLIEVSRPVGPDLGLPALTDSAAELLHLPLRLVLRLNGMVGQIEAGTASDPQEPDDSPTTEPRPVDAPQPPPPAPPPTPGPDQEPVPAATAAGAAAPLNGSSAPAIPAQRTGGQRLGEQLAARFTPPPAVDTQPPRPPHSWRSPEGDEADDPASSPPPGKSGPSGARQRGPRMAMPSTAVLQAVIDKVGASPSEMAKLIPGATPQRCSYWLSRMRAEANT